jgi:hypothetical protein
MAALVWHWRTHGLRAYAQFDNHTRFQGSHGFADHLGRATRNRLELGVMPVFAPSYQIGHDARGSRRSGTCRDRPGR